MTRVEFAVGQREKHALVVDWDWVKKRISIWRDGQKLVEGTDYLPGGRRFSFDVGTGEVHKVEVSIGFLSTLKISVDGKQVQGTSTQLEFE